MLFHSFASEFLGMFNHHLSKMRTGGVLDKIELKWLSPPRPQPEGDLNEVAEALGGEQGGGGSSINCSLLSITIFEASCCISIFEIL